MEERSFPQASQIPAVDEYRELRRVSGLSDKSFEAATRGLPNSLYSTTIRDGSRLIAMGRVVGDGGCDFSIVDIAVHPDYQRRGLGVRIMTAIMAYLEREAPASAYVALIADDHAPALYEKFGFKPTAPRSIGMSYRIGAQTRSAER